METSEFTLITYDDGVGYIGVERINSDLIAIPDFFFIKVFKGGMEKKSREVINNYYTYMRS